MIILRNLSKGFYVRGEYLKVLDSLNLELPTGKGVAVLGKNGAGKSTLLDLVAGTLRPDEGEVITSGSVSWPVGKGGALHGDLTGAQNTRFLARAYGVDSDELENFVEEFAAIGQHFHMPFRTYSAGMKGRLNFGISMGIPFETYLVDEVTAVGDAAFRRKSKAYFRDRMATAGGMMVSHNLEELIEFCDCALVLHERRIEYFEDVVKAIKRHEAQLAGAG